MQSGYDAALSLAAEKLAAIPPAAVCANCGVRHENGEFYVPWFSRERALSEAPTAQKIIWLHYLTSHGAKTPGGRLIPYREAPGARFYDANFTKRAVDPLVRRFGGDPEGLTAAGLALGGKKAGFGGASVTADVLPYLPMTFIIWAGDDEFGPGGSVLFDETAKTWFCAEDLAVLGSLAAHELINFCKK
ncbi:MAG: DUF3786 domain-containing protein [Firmicutes bacterium]|nr:DUF3786 domain-containing protein [Bacillota bacterium]